ncbi:NADH dehydrogenase [ubiquinone] 1 beta subcomplex subunit 11, mitochondrial [Sphaerodactylus townsendi]|uniref:NADH dehydrogenase [ubiquinone] 1 beta subcomplex subunit 11, mitochondrial n=1 Tax=Sphaerodactylus townsendi TaxID=933632 RepID=UPI002026CEA2|nr:NADH dehydrogenase [ubiquinone] 1 beta subcomplex subunit 11, mitochondrial [Sphaerodactylus townsendi]
MAAWRSLAGVQRLLGLPRLAARTASSGGAAGSAVLQAPPGTSPARVESAHAEENEEVPVFLKNPEFHGFDSDPVVDLWNMRVAFFFCISLAIVGGASFVHYLPDRGLQEWARREAEQKIKEREARGLPLIDADYYDRSKIVLPPEDEN